MAAPNPARQRAAHARLRQLFAHPTSVFVVHYACQSFGQTQQQGSPRIAAIAIRNLDSGQTTSFSIHQELELRRLATWETSALLDELEFAMLARYFDFIRDHKAMRFLHWNMRDLKFGFAALGHRFAVLGGQPTPLYDHQLHDLAIITSDIYGSDYAPRPHLRSLAKNNGFALRGFIDGKDEPAVFNRGEYSAVHQSTLCKVTLMADIASRIESRTLSTNANWWTLNKGRVRESCEMWNDNPMKALVGTGLAFGTLAFATVARLIN
jgi:hypothetical protein